MDETAKTCRICRKRSIRHEPASICLNCCENYPIEGFRKMVPKCCMCNEKDATTVVEGALYCDIHRPETPEKNIESAGSDEVFEDSETESRLEISQLV